MLVQEDSLFLLKINELDWDSSILGYKSGYFDIKEKDNVDFADNLDNSVKELLKNAREDGFRFLTAKIDSQNINIVNSCLKNGGILVDTELTFEKKSHSKNIDYQIDAKFRIEKYEKYWHEALSEIINTLKFSRFFVDKNIDASLAEKIWQTSIYNSCSGRASYSVICFDRDNPVGLMNVFEKDLVSDIFLIALTPEYQGHGLGKAMIGFYEKHLGSNIQVQKVETQLINHHAQNLYTSCGYKNMNSKYTVHFWL